MIILTTPHSECISKTIHTCDFLAPKAALTLQKIARSKNIETIIIPSRQNRSKLDDNRTRTDITSIDNSPLWKELREKFMEQYRKNKHDELIIIDVHSFPQGKNFNDREIAILDNRVYEKEDIKDKYRYQKIVEDLENYLSKEKVDVEIIQAMTGCNSIIDIFTLHPIYTKAMLIEFNEKLDDVRLEIICGKIMSGILEFQNSGDSVGLIRSSDNNHNNTSSNGGKYKKYKFVK